MYYVEKFGEFKPIGKQKKKHQIILSNTARNLQDYLQSLKYRYNGKYHRIPNYIVTREGKILKLLNNSEHTLFHKEINVNRNSITIVLENLGWLEKEPLNNQYVNWIRDIYNGNVYEKKWRDYFFWQPYTTVQTEALIFLCQKLFKEMSIKNQFIGHNTKTNGIENYEGVVCRSNYSSQFTDVSPAFNFELFLKNIENEQFT